MTATTTIQATQVLWDKTADKLYVWDDATKAWELFFVAADLVTNDALTADLALKVSAAGDTMTGALELPNIGINTTPDSTNKVAVKSNAVLFADIDTGSGGTGDIRFIVSKQAPANTASLLFQDDFSGRAEVGLCGDDNFHFKVSPDGSTFYDGIVLDKTSGQATFLTAPKITGMTSGSIPFFGASALLSQDNADLFWDTANKRLGVGTNVSGGWFGDAKAEIRSPADGLSLYVTATTGSGSAFFLRVDSTAWSCAQFYSSTTFVGSINTNGTTTTYGTSSSETFKDGISPMDVGFARQMLKASSPSSYVHKDGNPGHGFVVEHAQANAKAFGADLHALGIVHLGMKVMDYGKWTPFLACAVNNLYSITETQADKIARLELRVTELESEMRTAIAALTVQANSG